MPVFLGIVIALLVGAAGAAGGYLYRKQASEKKIGRPTCMAARITRRG